MTFVYKFSNYQFQGHLHLIFSSRSVHDTKTDKSLKPSIKFKVNLITSVSFGLLKEAGCTAFKNDCNLFNADLIFFSNNPTVEKPNVYST